MWCWWWWKLCEYGVVLMSDRGEASAGAAVTTPAPLPRMAATEDRASARPPAELAVCCANSVARALEERALSPTAVTARTLACALAAASGEMRLDLEDGPELDAGWRGRSPFGCGSGDCGLWGWTFVGTGSGCCWACGGVPEGLSSPLSLSRLRCCCGSPVDARTPPEADAAAAATGAVRIGDASICATCFVCNCGLSFDAAGTCRRSHSPELGPAPLLALADVAATGADEEAAAAVPFCALETLVLTLRMPPVLIRGPAAELGREAPPSVRDAAYGLRSCSRWIADMAGVPAPLPVDDEEEAAVAGRTGVLRLLSVPVARARLPVLLTDDARWPVALFLRAPLALRAEPDAVTKRASRSVVRPTRDDGAAAGTATRDADCF
jgi:hypothetical protein